MPTAFVAPLYSVLNMNLIVVVCAPVSFREGGRTIAISRYQLETTGAAPRRVDCGRSEQMRRQSTCQDAHWRKRRQTAGVELVSGISRGTAPARAIDILVD